MVCFDLGYEVVTDQVTVLQDNGSLGAQEFRLPAPSGKVPVAGGYKPPFTIGQDFVQVLASYPDDDEWVFRFLNGNTANRVVDIYLVTISE